MYWFKQSYNQVKFPQGWKGPSLHWRGKQTWFTCSNFYFGPVHSSSDQFRTCFNLLLLVTVFESLLFSGLWLRLVLTERPYFILAGIWTWILLGPPTYPTECIRAFWFIPTERKKPPKVRVVAERDLRQEDPSLIPALPKCFVSRQVSNLALRPFQAEMVL